MSKSNLIFIVLISIVLFNSCGDDPVVIDDSLTDFPYAPEAYPISYPNSFPKPVIPIDNPTTKEGVLLGRHLFYDPILSSDSSMSCSSCHLPHKNFTDDMATSKGVLGQFGKRSSMSTMNSVYAYNGFFWDGRSASLEDQALRPVEDPIELHENWPNVEAKLKKHPKYPELFRKAFGITKKSEITKELATKAIAQFERILVTGQNSIFIREKQGLVAFTSDQQEGHDMFFDLEPALPDAECNHCHAANLLTSNNYLNNGLDSAATYSDFKDYGRGSVTKFPSDTGKFKAPSLVNIALTAPYMHDGRFKTLEEVIDHYNSGGHGSPNKDNLIYNLKLTTRQKKQLLAFLHTFTDTSYYKNPDFFSPF